MLSAPSVGNVSLRRERALGVPRKCQARTDPGATKESLPISSGVEANLKVLQVQYYPSALLDPLPDFTFVVSWKAFQL